MGVVEIAIGISIAMTVASTVASLVLAPKSKQKMKRDIGSLQITQSEEGQCVPLVYGTVRVPGSIIWHGNLELKEAKPPGSKGGGGGGGDKNYKVYVDVHTLLCEGKITLDEIYKDEEPFVPEASLTFNDGTSALFEEYAEFATKMSGISHIYFKSWFLGENNYAVPSLSFKVTRIITGCPLVIYHTTTGTNPAIVLWDLLTKAGASVDLTSFQDAATFFDLKNIGLNLVFAEQQDLSKMLERVLSHTDLVLYVNNGTYYLKNTQSDNEVIADIAENEINEFVFNRISYNQVLNDFAANYIDENNTQRTVRVVNEAIYNIVGEYKNHSYDLTGYNNLATVKDRLSDIAKRESYPLSEISFTTCLKYHYLLPGSVFTITNSIFGMTQKKYRVYEIEKNIFENLIKVVAREHILDNFIDVSCYGEVLWADIDLTPQALDYTQVLDYKYGKHRDWTGKHPSLILAAKKTLRETGFDVYYSLDGGISFEFLQTCYGFFYHGFLKEEYSQNTYDIDDQHGILIEFDEQKIALDNLTRAELFTTRRIIVIGNEIMKFQTATDEGPYIRLLGVLRGDNKLTHTINTPVFIGSVIDNIVSLPLHTEVTIKICPKTFRGTLDISDATPISFTPNTKISMPTRIKATRAGDDVALEIWPNTEANRGHGIGSADIITDTVPHPFGFDGNYLVTIDSDPQIVVPSSSYTFTRAGVVNIAVVQQYHGLQSIAKPLEVGADDGEYLS